MSSTIEPLRDIFDAGGRGLQHQGLRRANERAVLTVIGFNAGVSNADIARLSGLAPQTVSAILTEIDRAGLITRGEVLRGRRGQPATPIFLKADGAYSIGVEIGWRHVDVLLLNLHAEVIERRRKAYDYPDAATIVADVAGMTADLVAVLAPEGRSRLTDMGVALPTNIAENLGLVAAPAEQQALWRKTNLVAELTRATGLEVSLFNDGNAACWAELIAFPKPRPFSFIYFLISRYIAAGIVGEGMLWEGPTGNSANLGSMLVGDSNGRQQPAHFTASITALVSRLEAAGIAVDANAMDAWDWTSFGPVLDQWLAVSAEALARVVFNTGTVIESGLVVVDGIMPRPIVERLVEQVSAALRQLPIAPYQPPQVMVGHIGPLAPSIGAAELTLYRRFFSRTLADIAG
jgi:predicted NBD/HSP70 family sugar kinase